MFSFDPKAPNAISYHEWAGVLIVGIVFSLLLSALRDAFGQKLFDFLDSYIPDARDVHHKRDSQLSRLNAPTMKE